MNTPQKNAVSAYSKMAELLMKLNEQKKVDTYA